MEQLALGASPLDVLVGARRVAERVHVADHYLELAGCDRTEQLPDSLAKQILPVSDHRDQPEADHPPGIAHQRSGVDLVRLTRSNPVGDQASERGQRRVARLECPSSDHLEDDVDGLPAVRIQDRRLEVVGVRVDGGVGAEPRRQLALVGARRDPDHPAGAQPLRELHRKRPDPARRVRRTARPDRIRAPGPSAGGERAPAAASGRPTP